MEIWLWVGLIVCLVFAILGGIASVLMALFDGWYGGSRSHAWVFFLFLTILFGVGTLLCANSLADKQIVVKIEASTQTR